jgi:hypothetical protein
MSMAFVGRIRSFSVATLIAMVEVTAIGSIFIQTCADMPLIKLNAVLGLTSAILDGPTRNIATEQCNGHSSHLIRA